jgi:hypothetical protein
VIAKSDLIWGRGTAEGGGGGDRNPIPSGKPP